MYTGKKIQIHLIGLGFLAIMGAGPAMAQSDYYNPYDTGEPPDGYCKLEDDIYYSGWSGQSDGTIHELSWPSSDWHALRNITNWQAWGDGCDTQIDLLRMVGATDIRRLTSRILETCNGHPTDAVTVGNVSENITHPDDWYPAEHEARDDFYITAVQTCLDSDVEYSEQTVDGIAVQVAVMSTAVINEGNGLDTRMCEFRPWDPDSDPRYVRREDDSTGYIEDFVRKDKRNGCRVWEELRTCPPGTIGTGLQLNENAAGISGMQLICRAVGPSWNPPMEFEYEELDIESITISGYD